MFTGIVEAVGRVVRVRQEAGGRRFTVDAGPVADGIVLGASMCVNGACLTVAAIAGTHLDFDAILETIEHTTLGRLQAGDRVNLERSLRPDGRLDGHFVQGHVDGTAIIRERTETDRERVLWFEMSPAVQPYIVPKGSVAIDGISLTIAALKDDRFSVALIPTTIRETTLWARQVGDAVNVETDILARTVVHWLRQVRGEPNSGGLTLSKLREHGFA